MTSMTSTASYLPHAVDCVTVYSLTEYVYIFLIWEAYSLNARLTDLSNMRIVVFGFCKQMQRTEITSIGVLASEG